MLDTPENCAIIDLGDPNNPDHIICPRCLCLKEAKHFMRRATKEQALAWGYSGRIRLEYVGKSCKTCHKPPKPLSQLTPLQIKQRISSGNHVGSEGRAKVILQNRIARGKAGIVQGITNRMQKIAAQQWAGILEDAGDTVKRFSNQVGQLKFNASHPLRIAYTKRILDIARLHEKSIQYKIKNGERKPEHITTWQHLMSEKEKAHITADFNAIPPEVRARMTHRSVLNVTGGSVYEMYAPKKE